MIFVPCELAIWPMTFKNNRAPLLYYIKLCASFQSHRWTQAGVTDEKLSLRVKISNFFVPCDLEIWQMTLKNNKVPVLCYFKLCASFHSHQWIKTAVTVRKPKIRVKSMLLAPCELEIWYMTLKNNRAPLLCHINLCVSLHWSICEFKLELQSGNG